MSNTSRRGFLAAAATAVITRSALSATAPLRVQYTVGGHTVPISGYTMFADDLFADLDTMMTPHPAAFENLNGSPTRPGPEVLVLYDYLTEKFSDQELDSLKTYLESGKGLVVLHHALCDSQDNPYWYQEVTGGALVQRDEPGIKRGRLKQFPTQNIRPVGTHPIIKGIQPFQFPRDEVFVDMWLSPKITPLLESDDPDLTNKVIAWLGVHPKGRVVCYESGHTPFACQDPRYRRIVHNMILWAGGRLTA